MPGRRCCPAGCWANRPRSPRSPPSEGHGLPIGQAVSTTAGRLPACWVVHTVGPVHSATEDRSELLRACYQNSLRVADGLGAETIAFPLISAGIYRWPVDDAVRQALTVLRTAETDHLRTAYLVLFGPEVAATARTVAGV
ncbi:macro domain-containing protein [Actinoplanes cyaneus]|uniref:macro domain-containing protein n=1 Tax=Actinoplanes cyaneus TaxID=52696 RepID=UPI0019416848|nr:macro domain-containing protein [Actinoplanes cyaneus]